MALSMGISTSEVKRAAKWGTEPTVVELLLLVALGGALFGLTLIAFHGWHSMVLIYGDNGGT